MFVTMIDMWIARYISNGQDMSDVRTIQTMLEEDLRETVPVNLIHASNHRVNQVRARLSQE